MDKFYVNYIKKQGIICDEFEAGCHRKEVIKTLNCESHYQYGQIVRYRLMLEYGFKSEVLFDLRLEQFDEETLSLNLEYDEDTHFKHMLMAQDIEKVINEKL